jgi:hypothetical protein
MAVLIRMFVTRAVHLDRQPRVVAVEVENERADRMLSSEPDSIEFAASNFLPEQNLGQGQLAAEFASSADGELWGLPFGDYA